MKLKSHMDALFNLHIVVWKKNNSKHVWSQKKFIFLVCSFYNCYLEKIETLYKIFVLVSITNMWWLLALYPIITWYICIRSTSGDMEISLRELLEDISLFRVGLMTLWILEALRFHILLFLWFNHLRITLIFVVD